jgi:tight adherence protein B
MHVPVPLIAAFAFGSAACLVLVVADLFASAYQRYEDEYLKSAEVSFDQIYLNIPARQLLYVAIALFFLFTGMTTLLFGSLLVGLAIGLLAFASPRLLAILLKRRRDRRFGVQLVDALMNISNALRSGFSLPQAFELIQREMENPISQEFRLINQETRIGVPLEQASNTRSTGCRARISTS